MRRLLATGLLLAAPIAGADALHESARKKIALIEEDRAAPGSRVWFTLKELNAYVTVEALKKVPKGLRSPRLELGAGSATAFARIDFLKVRELKGPPPNPLVAWFLQGERPVRVAARIQSGQGSATVFVDEVQLSGLTVRGAALDFLIDNFLKHYYPEAVIGRPFALKHRMDRMEITSAGVTVVIQPRR
jgi:hypothetical protein